MRYGYIKNVEAYLAHHGIEGQKWGVRNGPPYPLSAEDHSAREKKLNNGHYSQGVKQDRSGSGGGGGSSSGKTEEELRQERAQQYADKINEKRKKVAKTVAIATGIAAGTAAVTTAVATTAGLAVGGTAVIKHIAKNPNATKQAINNIGSSLISGLDNISKQRKINQMSDPELKKTAKQWFKESKRAERTDRALKLNAAKMADTRHKHFKENRKIFEANERKKALANQVDNAEFKNTIFNHPEQFTPEVQEAVRSKENGLKLMNEYNAGIRANNEAKRLNKQAKDEYRNTHGIRGAYNKAGRAYDSTVGFASKNIDRYRKGAYVVGALGALTGADAYIADKKRKKQQRQQQEAMRYYY